MCVCEIAIIRSLSPHHYNHCDSLLSLPFLCKNGSRPSAVAETQKKAKFTIFLTYGALKVGREKHTVNNAVHVVTVQRQRNNKG